MTETSSSPVVPALPFWRAVFYALGAVVAFELAYTFSACSFIIVIYLYCLFQLARLKSARLAFYTGLAIGVLAYAPQSLFFWKIFGLPAIALWFVLAFWIGLFAALAQFCLSRLGRVPALLLAPFLWTGLEYFRSELYYLRFSWLNVGYAFAGNLPGLPFRQLGVYGVGFVCMAAVSFPALLRRKYQFALQVMLLTALGFLVSSPPGNNTLPAGATQGLPVAGVQMEFPAETEVVQNLDRLIQEYPQARLLVLSEYTVDGPVPERIKAWCAKNQRYLIIGGKDPAPNDTQPNQFYDTAFVVGTNGGIVFQQAKSVPVQFFADGLPAREQKLWESPWGKIGICICYDLSYTRVTDQLVRLGAQAIIVPSMDAADWGRRQHELHARVAPVRAAEYGIPIFRVGSSGISQCVDSTGRTLATAPTPGELATILGALDLKGAGTLPLDRILAPVSAGLTGLVIGWLALLFFKGKYRKNQT